MAACYHESIVFNDPAFGQLKGQDARDMWRMLCQNSEDLRISYRILEESPDHAKVHWEANYTFSKTGRTVHNIIRAEMVIKNDKIVKHTDRFDLHRWASQAMGWKGKLLGWTQFFKKKLQEQTGRLLRKFQNS